MVWLITRFLLSGLGSQHWRFGLHDIIMSAVCGDVLYIARSIEIIIHTRLFAASSIGLTVNLQSFTKSCPV
jgi:hypothetical protein